MQTGVLVDVCDFQCADGDGWQVFGFYRPFKSKHWQLRVTEWAAVDDVAAEAMGVDASAFSKWMSGKVGMHASSSMTARVAAYLATTSEVHVRPAPATERADSCAVKVELCESAHDDGMRAEPRQQRRQRRRGRRRYEHGTASRRLNG